MKKQYLILLLNTIVFISSNAQNVSPVSEKEFSKIINLTGESVNFDKILYMPAAISISGNYLVILDEGFNNYFRVYSYPDIIAIGSYGMKGEGPDEINFPPTFSSFSGEVIEYFDFQRTSLYKINIGNNNNGHGGVVVPKLDEVLPPELIEAQNAIKIDTSIVFGSGVRQGKLFFYNIQTDSFEYSPFLPELKKIPAQHKHIIYSGNIASRPDKEFVVFASKYFDNYEVYEKNGKKVVSYNNDFEEQIFMKNGQLTNDNTVVFYTSLFATKNYFYLAYLGKSINQLLNLYEGGKLKCEIQKYDWNGKQVASYIINLPVKSFCVDEKLQRIYIINPLSEDNPVVRFNY